MLPESVTIYVPATMGRNGRILPWTRARILRHVMQRMADVFGACTKTEGEGYWEGIRERVTLVTSYAESVNRDAVLDIARDILRLMRQDAVAVVINGRMEFVTELVAA